MKISINLASQPFRRDRAMLVASIAVAVLLVGSLGALILLARADNAQLADVRKEVGGLRAQIAVVDKEQRDAVAILRQPRNAEVLETSVFLNTLLYRKGISWTRILADLEKTLPPNVKVINIRPFVSGKGQITLDMLVGAQDARPVIAMYKALEDSPLFGEVQQQQSMPPSQAEPLYRYRFSVNYAQKL
jgi:type IV pilus assembly protein PilN